MNQNKNDELRDEHDIKEFDRLERIADKVDGMHEAWVRMQKQCG